MKKFLLLAIPLSLFSLNTFTQEQSGTISGDITQEIQNWEAPPLKLDLAFGYESNIDLLDKTQYKIKYLDNAIMNIGGATKFEGELLDNPLSYSTSLKATLMEDSDYEKSSDVIRRMNFNNSFFLKMTSANEKITFGPTLDLNAEKRFTHPEYHRKRDNVNGAIGFKADIKASSEVMVSPAVSVGYLDHNGNYVDLKEPKRAFEHNLEEDRSIVKAGITTAWKANSILTLSMPLAYQRDNFTEKRARSADIAHAPLDRDLASWSAITGQEPIDQALDIQNISAGLSADLALIENVSANLGYTYLDDREMNLGHQRNNTDTDVYSLGLNGSLENISVALSYENENIRYSRIYGGNAKEITQVYASKFTLGNILPDTSAILDFKYTDYQATLPHVNWAEKAIDKVAMIGISTTL